jgi:hypothetical protein
MNFCLHGNNGFNQSGLDLNSYSIDYTPQRNEFVPSFPVFYINGILYPILWLRHFIQHPLKGLHIGMGKAHQYTAFGLSSW